MVKNLIFFLFINFILSNSLSNDVKWVIQSKEYKALCHQTYKQASIQLDNLLKKHRKKKKLAVIMDLDETVLDNSQYQIELYDSNSTFSMQSWAKWVEREEADAVPGSVKYIKKLRKNNIQIIFISNRMDERLEFTIRNMKKLELYNKNDIYLLRRNRDDKKTIRRDEVYNSTGRMKAFNKFKVIQYFGDAMGDFPNKEFNNFGENQFMFPNPMYGKWQK